MLQKSEKTVPDVFILESLDKDDVLEGRLEGERIAHILRLAGKDPKYYYFHSFEELEHLLALYSLSGYRYLHFSTHANSREVGSQSGAISYAEFASLLEGRLNFRRLFFSACQIGNEKFAKSISQTNPDIHSIIAPSTDVAFSHAIASWSAFYLSMFSKNENGMSKNEIKGSIEAICHLFPFEFYYASHSLKKDEWEYFKFSKK